MTKVTGIPVKVRDIIVMRKLLLRTTITFKYYGIRTQVQVWNTHTRAHSRTQTYGKRYRDTANNNKRITNKYYKVKY